MPPRCGSTQRARRRSPGANWTKGEVVFSCSFCTHTRANTVRGGFARSPTDSCRVPPQAVSKHAKTPPILPLPEHTARQAHYTKLIRYPPSHTTYRPEDDPSN